MPWYKRLEAGTFRFPHALEGAASVEVKASELAMLLEGIDLRSVKRVKRYDPAGAASPPADECLAVFTRFALELAAGSGTMHPSLPGHCTTGAVSRRHISPDPPKGSDRCRRHRLPTIRSA